mmetsp:Transcript_3192/g.8846  ORF Transcript_3192/g.8846 Transcript_3192/m.8846 type:complete len:100 (-) Transcript_3192:4698-4997(-)
MVAAKSRFSFLSTGLFPKSRKTKAVTVPPSEIKNPLTISIRLQTLGLVNMKEMQYEKDATAGPNKTIKVRTALNTPFSVVVRLDTSKTNIRSTVIQHGI